MDGLSFVIKCTCETDLLYDSLDEENKGNQFGEKEGKAHSLYFVFSGMASIAAGFLFVVNHYIPVLLAFLIVIFSFIISLEFKEVNNRVEEEMKDDDIGGMKQIKKEFIDIVNSFKSIIKSKRLISLLLFNALFVAGLRLGNNLRNPILVEINMPEQYFGIISAGMGLIAAIFARIPNKIHNEFRNRTLTFLSIMLLIPCILMGVIPLLNIPRFLTIIIILVLFGFQYMANGPYSVISKRYANNFTNSDNRIKISAASNLIESTISTVILYASAIITDNMEITYATITIGIITFVVMGLLLCIMRKTIGLKYEEYSKKELLQEE